MKRGLHDVKCDGCGVLGTCAHLPGGWWSYPNGWFVMDNNVLQNGFRT